MEDLINAKLFSKTKSGGEHIIVIKEKETYRG